MSRRCNPMDMIGTKCSRFDAKDAIRDCAQNRYTGRFFNEIREAAERGEHYALLAYTDCGGEMRAAIREVELSGIQISTFSEFMGGVMQHEGFYAIW